MQAVAATIAPPFTATPTVPAQPGPITIAELTESSFKISWVAAFGTVDSYTVSVAPTTGVTNPVASVNASALEYTFTGLTEGTQYTVSVVTVSGGGSSVARIEQQWTNPNAPEDFAVATITTTTVGLSWTEPDSTNGATFDKYRITYTTSGDAAQTKDADKTATGTALAGLSPGVQYTISLVAVSADDSIVSAEASGGPLTVRTKPNAPTGFIGTSTSPTTIGLSWTVPSTANGATFAKYRIIYTPDGVTSYVEEIFDPTATSITLTGLSPGVQYTISLVAVGAVPNPTESAEAAGGPLTLGTNPNAPGDLAVATFTTTTVGLSWTEPDSANGATFDKYRITYTTSGDAAQTKDADKTATSTALTGLSPGVQYTISLVAVSADDSIVSAEASGGPLTVRTKPNAPTGFTGTSTSPTTIGLSWTVPSTANGATFAKYRIIYTPDGVTSYVEEIFDPTATSTNLTGLSPGVQYTISLVAVGAVPNPTESAEAAGGPLTLRTNPNAPEHFAVTTFTTTTFGLSWMEPDSANGATFAKYTITYAPTGHAPQTVDVDKTATGTTLTGLSPGVQYTISLVAVSADDSIVSAEASGGPLTVRTKPNAPTGFTGTSITTSTIGLNWAVPSTANGATFDKYRITYTTGGTSYSLEVTDATATSTTLTGLSPGVQYTISLVAVSADPNTTESAEATGGPLTVRTKPNAPIDFAGTSITTTTIGLNWTVPSAANGVTFDKFRITYTPDGGSSQVKEITDISATSTTLTGLSSGALYTISLVAVSTEPNPTESAEASGGPLTVRTNPNAPEDFAVATITTTTVGLSWIPPDSANGATFEKYRITYIANGIIQTEEFNNPATISTTLTGLSPGVQYSISLVAVGAVPNPTESAEASGGPLTVRTNPNAPEDFAVATITTTTVGLSWIPPDSANGATFEKYRITYIANGISQTKEINNPATGSTSLTGLSPGVLYTISLFAVSDDSNVTVSAEASGGPLTVRTKPNAPQSFTAETLNATTIGLSWTEPDSANGATLGKYRITYTPTGDAAQTVDVDKTTTSIRLTGLSPGVQYTISLVAVSADDSIISAEASGGPLTVRTNPNAPGDLAVATFTTTTVGLSWTEPDSANGATFAKYTITYAPTGHAPQTVDVDKTASSTTLTGLSPGVQYTISLVAVGAVPNPTESAEAAGGPLTLRTKNFAVTSFTTTTFGLSWMEPDSANGATFAKYTITYAPTGHAPQTVDVDKTATSTTLTGLSPGVQYTIRLVAVGAVPNPTESAEAAGGPLTLRTNPNAPEHFAVTTFTTTTFGLSWMEPDSANGATFAKYTITYAPTGHAPQTVDVDKTATGTTLTGLSPGVQYTISLVAVSADDSIVSAEASGGPLTVRTKPNAPTGFTGTGITTSTIGLNWAVPSTANGATFDKYRITYTTGGTSYSLEVTDATATSTTLTGLSPGVQYTISLVAVSADPNTTESAEATGGPLTVRTKPNAPIGFAGTSITTTTIGLNWTVPSAANGVTFDKFRITYTPDGGSSQVKEITDTSATSTTLTGLCSGTLYTISLVAVSAEPNPTESAEASGGPLTVRTNPNAPEDFAVATITTTTVGLSWIPPDSANGATFEKYRITYIANGIIQTEEFNNPATISTTLTGLSPGVQYSISLVAVGAVPNPTESAEASGGPLTVRTNPNAPEDFAVATITTTTVGLSWIPPDSANGAIFEKYRITYIANGISQTEEINNPATGSTSLTGLSPGVLYTISLFAVSDDSNVTVSAEASGGPLTVRTKPNAPQSFTAETLNATTIGLSWTEPDSANGATLGKYRITYTPTGDAAQTVDVDKTTTSIRLTGLSPGVQYTISLVAVSADDSIISAEASGGPLTVRTNPNAPGDLAVATFTTTTVGLSWTEPDSANGATFDKYRITYTTSGDAAQAKDADKTATGTTLTGLSPGVQYTISLVAVSADDSIVSTEASGGPLTVRTSEFFRLYSTADKSPAANLYGNSDSRV
ncbi:fibronectin-like [Branchiostoma floridae x Branchiostoma japonicum]